MQVGTAQAGSANAHDDIPWAGDLWLSYFLDVGKFMIVVQTDCFHLYSSIGNSSGPTKREPGRPHSRKKSPVARHKVTLTSLPARIKARLRRLARAILSAVAFEPSLSARSGESRSRACVRFMSVIDRRGRFGASKSRACVRCMTPLGRRGRFIEPIADLSALCSREASSACRA